MEQRNQALVLAAALVTVAAIPSFGAAGDKTDDTTELIECDANLEECDGGSSSDTGTETDRQWVAWDHEVNDSNRSFIRTAGAASAEITCFTDYFPSEASSVNMTISITFSCNDDFGLMVPDPKIALVVSGGQPPECGEPKCSGGVGLVPVFGNWTGSLEATLYQDALPVDATTIPLPARDYGLISFGFETNLDSFYQVEFKLVNDLGTVVSSVTQDVPVETQEANHTVRQAQWVKPTNPNAADYLYAVHTTVVPKDGSCTQVLGDSGADLATKNTSAGFETESQTPNGGLSTEPSTARAGLVCGPWEDLTSFSGVQIEG